MLFTGANPLDAYGALLSGCFGSPVNLSETIVYVTPLICTGLSIAVAFRAGLFNIGAEGQMIVGMLASAIVGYTPVSYTHLDVYKRQHTRAAMRRKSSC